MPEQGYLADLDIGGPLEDRIRVRIVTHRGEVVDFVAQFEAMIEERFFPVVRYDGSHGRGHRDVLDRHGQTVRKDWLPENVTTLAEALNHAIDDIYAHWRRYRSGFLAHEGFSRERS